MRGEMLWFNETKDFGFIRTDEGERLYVQGSDFTQGHIPTGRCAGTRVTFDRAVVGDDHVPRAVGVSVVDEVAARRARRHSRSHAVG